MSGDPSFRDLLEVATDAALAAGAVALKHFENGVTPEKKPDGTPVSVADRAAERELRRVIAKAFPSHAILGEEEGETAGDAKYRWILDPIDGTKTFVQGVPLWGVLVAVEVRGDPSVGVVHLPALGETIAAARGEGATRDGWPCHVSLTPRVEDAVLVTTSPRQVRRDAPGYAALADRAQIERGWSDCYAYGLVASGRADIAVDAKLKPWDIAPFVPIVEEAGGRITDWRGERTIHGGNVLITNGLLHDEVLASLTRAPAGR